MADAIPEALPVGPEDDDKRTFAWDLMKASNEVIVGFAKLMSTISLTAIGVLLSLAKLVGLGSVSSGWQLALLSVACVLYLVAVLVFSYVVRGQRIDISPDDYDDVVEQFLAAARVRQRMTNVGLGLLAVGTSCGLAVILEALSTKA